MNTKIRLLLAFLIVILGIGLSGALFRVIGKWETPATRVWPLAENKAGQVALWGRAPGSFFGGTTASGDVNGDGFDDLIANARYFSDIGQGVGEVYVLPGPLAFNTAYTMPHKAAIVFQEVGSYPIENRTCLESGDMNGDGFDDIAMGSWLTGTAYVYLGSSKLQASSPLTIAVVPQNMALTITPMDGLEFCDINGDGKDDLFAEQITVGNGGQVWGILGRSTWTMTQPITLTLPSEANMVIEGFHPEMWSSPNVGNMACGDVDGDGYSDLAIGVFGESPSSRYAAGTVYVIRGTPIITYSTSITLTMPDQAGAIIEGVDGGQFSPGDELGVNLAMADVNQDGRADLILGALGDGPNNLMYGAGEVYLWLGRALEGQRFIVSSQANWIVHGEKALDYLGRAIATGDFDGDGYPEVLLGCPGCEPGRPPLYLLGRGYVLNPLQIAGMVTVTAASQLAIVPSADARGLGQAVNALDMNGDGFGDLVLSAPYTDSPEETLPGTVYIISYPSHFKFFLPLTAK